MNYSRAFTYVFEDKNWLSKILIAGLISLIPIVGTFYLLGWTVEIIRRVKAGRTDILPTTHFSYFLTLGLKYFVVALIYSIPLIIISFIFSLISTDFDTYETRSLTIYITRTGFFGNVLMLLLQIATGMISIYGLIKLAETDQIKECLNFKDCYNTIKENLSSFLIVGLLSCVACSLISAAGAILCFIGIIFTLPYGEAVSGHLIGQLWKNLNTPKTGRSYRGTVEKVKDAVEEAPFTRVKDIENTAAPQEPEAEAQPVSGAETADEVHEAVNTDVADTSAETQEPVITNASEMAETVSEDQPQAENSVESHETAEASDNVPESTDEKPESDIPSFE